MNIRQAFQRLPARRRKQLYWASATVLAYLLIGFFVVPQLIKWQLLKQLPGITKRQTTVRQVRTNPLTLSLTIRDLALKEPDGRPFASFEEFYINFQTSSLFRWAWTFKEIRLVRPYGEIILMENGQLNFANMFAEKKPAPEPPAKEKGGIPRVNIFHLQLTNGFVAVQDRTRRTPFSTEYRPINFVLSNFSTRPDSDTPYSFRAESDAGRSVSWKGDFSVQPLKSSGTLDLAGLRLNAYQPYVEDFTKALLTNGVVDVHISYAFAAGTNGLDLLVTDGNFVLDGLDIRDPQTHETVAGIAKVAVTGAEMNLRGRSARVRDVLVEDASVLARVEKDGRINLQELMAKQAVTTNATVATSTPAPSTNIPPAQPWTFTLDHVAVTNAGLVFEDLSRPTPFKTTVKPVTLQVDGLSTSSGSNAVYSYGLITESDERLSGDGLISVNPVKSQGEITLTGLALKKYMPYAEDRFSGNLVSGSVNARVPYRFALGTNGIQAGASNLTVALSGLQIKSGDETLVKLACNVEGVEASLEGRKVSVGLITVAESAASVRREKDGSINLLKLLKLPAESTTNTIAANEQIQPGSPASVRTESQPAWDVVLKEFVLTNCAVKIEDRQPERPAHIEIDQLALNVRGASTDLKAPVSLDLALRLNQTGALKLHGKGTAAPQDADIEIHASNIDTTLAQSYIDPVIGLVIKSGALSTHGTAHYASAAPDKFNASFKGDVQLANFSCADTRVSKELAAWEDLLLKGLDATFSTTPDGRSVKIAEIAWVNPKATVVIGPDGSLNIPQQPGAPTPTEKPGSKPAPGLAKSVQPTEPASASARAQGFPIEIGVVTLNNGTFGFSDLSIQPNSAMAVEKLNGTIKGLSAALNTTADVDLAGTVGEQSPFAVTGKLNPLGSKLFVDLVISNANAQLSPFSGYMEKYAGHPLNKGRLTTSFHYLIDGKELKAENKIQIDQLTLGPRNNSPDATSLPVKLGVALLKDSNGRIELDVPVTGRLDDPQFKVGPIILKVVVNMLVKAATSPFKMLGALVGGGEELSFVEFTPGTTETLPSELEKLDKLKKALAARPALSVELQGWVDTVTDRRALALAKLKDGIKKKTFDELKARKKTEESLETFQMEPEAYEQALRGMVAEQFGTNLMSVLQSNLVATAAEQAKAAAVEKKKSQHGIRATVQNSYKAVVQFAGFGPRRSAAEKKLSKAEREALGQATPEMMERLLADTAVQVTPEEYAALMNARAKWVQNWLLETGGVAPERVLLTAPKNVDASYTGQSRTALTLN